MSKPNCWYDPTGFTNPYISLRDPGVLQRWREERKRRGYEAFIRQ